MQLSKQCLQVLRGNSDAFRQYGASVLSGLYKALRNMWVSSLPLIVRVYGSNTAIYAVTALFSLIRSVPQIEQCPFTNATVSCRGSPIGPTRDCRNFIERALESAAQRISLDIGIEESPREIRSRIWR